MSDIALSAGFCVSREQITVGVIALLEHCARTAYDAFAVAIEDGPVDHQR